MRFEVFVSSRGNVYMRELAEQVCEGIAATGRAARLTLDGEPAPADDRVNLIVAPHEFFPLHPTLSAAGQGRALAASACLNTEQPGNAWFELAAGFCLRARWALDVNPLGRRELARRGAAARQLQLGYVPSLDRWQGRDGERDVDLVFLGGVTPRRSEVLAGLGPVLWPYRSRILLFENDRPARAGQPGFLSGSEKRELLARTRFLLMVHRAETGYFDWLRGVEAMANGCVLVTEPVLHPEPLVPWRQFVEVPSEGLADYLVAALVDEPARRAMAEEAYEFVRGPLGPAARLESLLAALEEEAPVRRRSLRPRAGLRRVAAAARTVAAGALRPAAERAAAGGAAGLWALQARLGSAAERVKDDLLAEISHRRQIERLLSCERFGREEIVASWQTPGFAAAAPDVSVVVTLFNYAGVVEEALNSAASSVGVTPEILVVDDHSEDDSRDLVLAFLERRPGLAIELLARSANAGLPAARNLGFARARAPFVFVLDADNRLYPTALARLRDALVGSGAAFAYAIIEKFGARRGLLSELPWDPGRLARENYVDAMAMVRREAWAALGGYREDLALFGWEDYDLWLRAADRGLRGVLVPEILCQYRTQPESMIGLTNIETRRLRDRFRDEYPSLFA